MSLYVLADRGVKLNAEHELKYDILWRIYILINIVQ